MTVAFRMPTATKTQARQSAERLDRLNDLLAYSGQKAAEQGLRPGDGNRLVHEVRAKHSDR